MRPPNPRLSAGDRVTVYPPIYTQGPDKGEPIKSYDRTAGTTYRGVATRGSGVRVVGPGAPENDGSYRILIYSMTDPGIDIDWAIDWRDARGDVRSYTATDISTPRNVGAYCVPAEWAGSDGDGVPGVGGASGGGGEDGDGVADDEDDDHLDDPID